MSTLENELTQAINNGSFMDYKERAKKESELFLFGESVGWKRDVVIDWLVERQTMKIPRQRYECAFDNGKMRLHAMEYHNALMKWGKGVSAQL